MTRPHGLARLETDSGRSPVPGPRRPECLDSGGLRLIAVARRRTQDAGRRFALVPGAAQVIPVFDIARMRERLDFVDDPREVTAGT